ncbi:MAG: hypothetical protein LWW85_14935 [Marinilabiliales bacterium]|nr:hypothetical protein [Marinilabiliales bacterium]
MSRLILTGIILFGLFFKAEAATLDVKKLVGKWEYSAPTAPSNYTSGQIIFRMDGNKLKGELVIEGQKVDFSEITVTDEVISATVFLEGATVVTKFKLIGEALEGKADTPDGLIPVKAVRK